MKKSLILLFISALFSVSTASLAFAVTIPSLPSFDPCTIEVCGNGTVACSEACDDGNSTNGDGCNSSCQFETNPTGKKWICSAGSPTVCVLCGNSLVNSPETCDNGNIIDGDGCSNICQLEPGWFYNKFEGLHPICGDSLKKGSAAIGYETCDDGNTATGDGCYPASSLGYPIGCRTETGWTCSATLPSTCTTICGDGRVLYKETCDDSNTANGDGCSSTCSKEHGFICTGAPSSCYSTCGDRLIASNEQCDDGNTANGDGCSATCGLESGYVCGNEPSTCSTVCGDLIKAGTETCDDGNTEMGDGCDGSCQLEPGWFCSVNMTPKCMTICGDSIVAGAEECDDGNTLVGDGCNKTCQAEEGWNCVGTTCTINQGPAENPPYSTVVPHFTAMLVEGAINVGELVVNGATTFIGALNLQSDLRVYGQTWFYNVVTLGNDMTDTIWIAGPLKGSVLGYSDIFIDDNLDVSGTMNVDGNVTLGNNTTDTVNIPGKLELESSLTLGDPAIADPNTREPLWVYGISRLFGTVVAYKDLSVGRDLTVTGNITTTTGNITAGTATVTGKLKANSIGSIIFREAQFTVSAGNNTTQSKSCNAGEIRLSCGGGFAANSLGAVLNNIMPDRTDTLKCNASGYNGSATTQTIFVFAVCLDPDA